MLLPLNWLKDYVSVKIAPAKLAKLLTMAGIEVSSIIEKGDDKIFEIEITPNRPDWLSIIGLAREVATLTKSKLKLKNRPKIKPGLKEKKQFYISVQDKKDCPLYSARLVRDCFVGPATKRIINCIESVNLRAVNNIVDITNFCLYETGQPMHAFDFDKIEGSKIIVRRAKSGEKITTIDGIERKLDGRIMVIADASRPIAIAGVMGGKDTEVTSSTKNILLESAYFDAVLTRRASRMLGISTDSSYRFERKVDMDKVIAASDRAADMIADIAGGRISEFKAITTKRKETPPIILKTSEVNQILGLELKTGYIKEVLSGLGFKVRVKRKDVLKVRAPSFREDVVIKEDLIEEIARIYGYVNIPASLPPIKVCPSEKGQLSLYEQKDRVRNLCLAQGLSEAITYSLVNQSAAQAFAQESSLIKIANPLSAEQEYMRPLILSGLLVAVQRNKNRQENDVNLFEIGNVYASDKDTRESLHLAVVLSGNLNYSWRDKEIPGNIHTLKGVLETIFERSKIKSFSFVEKNVPFIKKGAGLAIIATGKELGLLGQVDPALLNVKFGIKDKVVAAEFDLEKILTADSAGVRFAQLPKYPASKRDISVVVNKEVLHSEVVATIKRAAGAYLKSADLADVYIGKQVPKGKKSLSYSLSFQSPHSTLTEQEVAAAFASVIDSLKKEQGAVLR